MMINEAVRHGGGNNFTLTHEHTHTHTLIVPFLLITVNNASARAKKRNYRIFQGCEAGVKEHNKN